MLTPGNVSDVKAAPALLERAGRKPPARASGQSCKFRSAEQYPPEMVERFEAALYAAGVPLRAGSYPAANGWMKLGFRVDKHEQAKWCWSAMIETFGPVLSGRH